MRLLRFQVQIVREIRYIEAPSFGPRPQVAMCSSCGSQVTTSTSKSLSLAAWTIILALCCLQACYCACIPCCLDSCKKVGGIIYKYKKFRLSITAQTANNFLVCTVDLLVKIKSSKE